MDTAVSNSETTVSEILTPPEIIMDFIEALPATIRETVALQVYAFVARKSWTGRPRFVPKVRTLLFKTWSHLPSTASTFRVGATISAAAALDHALYVSFVRRRAREKVLQEMAGEDDAYAKMAHQAPLQSRHFNSAWQQWLGLRSGPLSPVELQRWHQFISTGKAD